MVERILGKDEVAGSTPAISSKVFDNTNAPTGVLRCVKNELTKVKISIINVNN